MARQVALSKGCAGAALAVAGSQPCPLENRAPGRVRRARDRAAAGKRIVELAKSIITLVQAEQDPYVDIPSRTLSNVQFNEQKGIIELLDGKQRRYFFSLLGRRKGEGSQAKKFMQTVRVAEVCKRLIDANDSTSIRDLFYNLKVPIKVGARPGQVQGADFRRAGRVRSDHRGHRGSG